MSQGDPTEGRRTGRWKRFAGTISRKLANLPEQKERNWPTVDVLGQVPSCEGLVDAVQADAQAVYEQRDARLARIDNRATTLQATVGIATALVFAAAGVILDPSRVDESWRWLFAVPLAAVVILFLATGYLAAQASLTRERRDFPTVGESHDRVMALRSECAAHAAQYKWAQAETLLVHASANAVAAHQRTVASGRAALQRIRARRAPRYRHRVPRRRVLRTHPAVRRGD
jgi:hypothetical protein